MLDNKTLLDSNYFVLFVFYFSQLVPFFFIRRLSDNKIAFHNAERKSKFDSLTAIFFVYGTANFEIKSASSEFNLFMSACEFTRLVFSNPKCEN